MTTSTLEKALQASKVAMTRHEFAQLCRAFRGQTDGTVSYRKMSEELGLHKSKLNAIQPAFFNRPQDTEDQRSYREQQMRQTIS